MSPRKVSLCRLPMELMVLHKLPCHAVGVTSLIIAAGSPLSTRMSDWHWSDSCRGNNDAHAGQSARTRRWPLRVPSVTPSRSRGMVGELAYVSEVVSTSFNPVCRKTSKTSHPDRSCHLSRGVPATPARES